jgi:hypothetical protein
MYSKDSGFLKQHVESVNPLQLLILEYSGETVREFEELTIRKQQSAQSL